MEIQTFYFTLDQLRKITVFARKISEAVAQRCSVKRVLLEISQNLLVFSCEFLKISENIFFLQNTLKFVNSQRVNKE